MSICVSEVTAAFIFSIENCSTLKTEAVGFSGTFLPIYQTTRHHHIPKDRENSKSHIKGRVNLNYCFAECSSPAGSARAFFFVSLTARFF
jgi:hypothetical protein